EWRSSFRRSADLDIAPPCCGLKQVLAQLWWSCVFLVLRRPARAVCDQARYLERTRLRQTELPPRKYRRVPSQTSALTGRTTHQVDRQNGSRMYRSGSSLCICPLAATP